MELTALHAIGMGIIALCGLIGGIIARDRYIMKSISTGDQASANLLREYDKDMDVKIVALHDRINETRDEMVRKADLATYIDPLRTEVAKVYNETRETNKRIDDFMSRASRRQH